MTPITPTSRLTAADFDQELLILFDAYVHGDMDRRGFLQRAEKFAKGGVTAAAILASLQPNFAAAQVVPANDARLKIETVTVASPEGSGSIKAYVAKPANASGRLPAVLVIHENRGLNPHIEDITRRIALDGYVAFAPDALTALGGYPGDEDEARAEFAKLDQTKIRTDFLASYAALKARADVTGKVGSGAFAMAEASSIFSPRACPIWPPVCRFMAITPPRKKLQKSKRHCKSILLALTSASTPLGLHMKLPSKLPTCAMWLTSTRIPNTALTMTRPHASMPQPRNWPGSGRWGFSSSTWLEACDLPKHDSFCIARNPDFMPAGSEKRFNFTV